MSAPKIALVAVVSGLGFFVWKQHQVHVEAMAIAAITDNYGFMSMAPPSGGRIDEVLVVAAQNCPKEDARRADELAQELAERNIPHARISSISFDLPPGADPDVFTTRHNAMMNSQTPLVFVNGKVKSNPLTEEVIAEYEAVKL